MKNYFKKSLPKWLLNLLKSIKRNYKLIKHLVYYKKIKIELFITGLYFTFFERIYKSNGLIIHVPFDLTDFQFRGRFALHRYEVEEAKYIDKYLEKDAKVLELGGCLGYISCLINKKLIDKTQQVTLEANPNLIEWIKKNRDENECLFVIENSIISHQKKNIFYLHNRIVGGSTKRKTTNKAYVNGVDIEFLNKKYNIEFDTLIMDIEGGELDIIKNFKESLSKFKRIFLEVHPFGDILTQDEVKTCEDTLLSIGFDLIVRDKNFQIWDKKLLE